MYCIYVLYEIKQSFASEVVWNLVLARHQSSWRKAKKPWERGCALLRYLLPTSFFKFQVNLDPRFRHFLKTEKPLGMMRLFSGDSYRIFSKERFTLKQKSSGISIQ